MPFFALLIAAESSSVNGMGETDLSNSRASSQPEIVPGTVKAASGPRVGIVFE